MYCSAVSRQELLWISQLEALHERLVELRTPNILAQVMHTALTGWAQDNGYQYPTVPTRTHPDRRWILHSGLKTGLDGANSCRGCLAQEFQSYATPVHFGRPVNLYVSHTWSLTLFSWLWDQVESQWMLRNESLHGTDIEDTRSKIRGHLTEAVMYSR